MPSKHLSLVQAEGNPATSRPETFVIIVNYCPVVNYSHKELRFDIVEDVDPTLYNGTFSVFCE